MTRCQCAEDGYFWVLGRMDDIINVSGHRIGTAEVESALVAHPACAEAATVGYEHPIKGLGIYAYVSLIAGTPFTDGLQNELRQCALSTAPHHPGIAWRSHEPPPLRTSDSC